MWINIYEPVFIESIYKMHMHHSYNCPKIYVNNPGQKDDIVVHLS